MHPGVTMFAIIAMLAALHAPVVPVLSTDPLTLHDPNSKPAGNNACNRIPNVHIKFTQLF